MMEALFTFVVWILIGPAIIIGVLSAIKASNPKAFVGKIGERVVNEMIMELDPDKYILLKNLLLPSDGKVATSQIDHVVVSNYGIFVIKWSRYVLDHFRTRDRVMPPEQIRVFSKLLCRQLNDVGL